MSDGGLTISLSVRHWWTGLPWQRFCQESMVLTTVPSAWNWCEWFSVLWDELFSILRGWGGSPRQPPHRDAPCRENKEGLKLELEPDVRFLMLRMSLFCSPYTAYPPDCLSPRRGEEEHGRGRAGERGPCSLLLSCLIFQSQGV